jgi:hypothetical protein
MGTSSNRYCRVGVRAGFGLRLRKNQGSTCQSADACRPVPITTCATIP